jgi:uncharacterized protein YjbI with pentapeptide repeats
MFSKPARASVGLVMMVVAVAGALLLLLLIVYGYLTEREWVGVADKSLWDWLKLLVVPAVLAVAGFLLSDVAQRERDLDFRQSQANAESSRAQTETLRAYLDQMSNLIVDLKLRAQPKDSDACRLAQARTLGVLASLDQDRKRDPLYLIYELNLINKDTPHLSLKKANFAAADLSEMTLHEASLREADFRRADLKGSDLKGSDLSDADLRGADLSDAELSDVSLAGANLLPYDQRQPAKLNAPHLAIGVDPTDIDLNDDRVIPTKLSGANLRGADLSGAYLAGVIGITNEELELQASSLQGAIMPDGTIHD